MSAINSIKQRSDRTAVAIRTQFDDTPAGPVTAWLSVTSQGISAYLTEAEVADWNDLYTPPGTHLGQQQAS